MFFIIIPNYYINFWFKSVAKLVKKVGTCKKNIEN